MDILLQHHQSVLRRLRQVDPTTFLKELFNEIVVFLNNSTNNQNDCFHILTIVCNDLAVVSILKVFNDPEICNHQFFILLSNTFKMFLTKLAFIELTKQDEECFDGISLFISSLCLINNQISTSFYTDNNEKLDPKNKESFQLISYAKIFFPDIIIKTFVKILNEDISINDYPPWNIKYKIADRLLRLFIKLKDIDHRLTIDSVIKCIESDIFVNLYKTIDLYQLTLNPKQSFFMYQCPKYIRLCSFKRQDEISYSLSKPLIKCSAEIFEKHLPIALYIEDQPQRAKIQATAWFIEFLNHFALTPQTREFFLRHIYPDKTMIDQMIKILKTEALIKSVSINAELFHCDVALMSYSITLLYNLTFEKKIFLDLKSKNVIDICKKLFDANDKTIQFAARTLAAILNKEDIDEIDSPTKVARSYSYFIENTLDDITLTYHGIKLDGILTNLEAIVQNDEVKEEITNDEETIPLLARCAYEPHLDVQTIQRPALRIIDTLSFVNDSAIEQIKEDDLLMEHIRSLSAKNDAEPGTTANRLLWKVEEEKKFISKQKKTERKEKHEEKVFDEKKAIYQYVRGDHHFNLDELQIHENFDIIISFCEKDQKLPYEIYNRLVAPDFYRISFDKDNKHSSDPELMATNIEQSAIFIMCISSKYRNSNACRLEAEYARKRKRPIIPVNIEVQYQPTGWLKDIINDEQIIDFNKEFNTAYAQLIDRVNEIYEQSQNNCQ